MAKKSSTPKVVIVTRTSNRSVLLKRALESVQAQTFQDYVHVILNDGGDKKALESVLAHYPSDKRMVIHNETGPNLTKALNQGIRAASSEYVTILDDDDSWPKERLEKTISHLDATRAKAVIVKMDIVIEEIEGDTVRTISQHLHPESGEGEVSLFKQCYKNYISNGIVTYRRDVYEELGGYDESLEVGEDWDFGIRLLMKYDVDFLRNEGPLFFYHQRPKQTGADGNSVHARVAQQEKTITVIRNRYLRDDLNAGKFGVGYIMNSLAYGDSVTVRLEGHMNHVGDEVKTRLDEMRGEVKTEFEKQRQDTLYRKVRRKVRSTLQKD